MDSKSTSEKTTSVLPKIPVAPVLPALQRTLTTFAGMTEDYDSDSSTLADNDDEEEEEEEEEEEVPPAVTPAASPAASPAVSPVVSVASRVTSQGISRGTSTHVCAQDCHEDHIHAPFVRRSPLGDSSDGSKRSRNTNECSMCTTTLVPGLKTEDLNMMCLYHRTLPSWTCVQWFEIQQGNILTLNDKRWTAFVRNGHNHTPLIFETEAEMLHVNMRNQVEVRLPLGPAYDTINKIDQALFFHCPHPEAFYSSVSYTPEGVSVWMTPVWCDPVIGMFAPKPFYTGQKKIFFWPLINSTLKPTPFVQWIMCTDLKTITAPYCPTCAKWGISQ